MPQIPVAENQVSLRPAPITERRSVDVSSGLHAAGNALTQHHAKVEAIRKQEALDMDRAAFMDADRETDATANDLFNQGQSAQLKDAIGISPKLLADYDKRSTEIENRLTTDRQKLVYREAANNKRTQLQRQLDSHERGQTDAYYAKSREDYKEQAHLNAVTNYSDPKVVEAEIAKIGSVVSQSPGMDDEQKATELGVRRSGVYAGVIERYLANDQIKDAEAYYKSIKGNVNGDRASRIENAINDAKRQAEARFKANQAEARNLLSDDVQDAYARRQVGLTANIPSQARFVAAYGKDGATRYKEASQRMGAYDVAAEVALLPPAEAAAKLAELRPKEGDTGGEASKLESYRLGVQLATQQRQQLESDPAAVLQASDPSLQRAAEVWRENPNDPAAVDGYFNAMAARQQVLGVEKPKLLSDSQARSVSTALQFDPENPKKRASALAQLDATYGKWMPQILQEVAPSLDGHARVLVNMKPEYAVRLDTALANKKDIEASVPSEAKTDVTNALDEGLADFANSLADNPDAGARVAEHREAAKLLAMDMVLRGTPANDAARFALEQVVNGNYTYRGQGADKPNLRIPRGLDPDAVQTGAARQRMILSTEKDFAVTPVQGFTAEEAQKDMQSAVRRSGYWVVGEVEPGVPESGLILKIPHRSGNGVVRRKDGSPVTMTWQQAMEVPVAEYTPMAVGGLM